MSSPQFVIEPSTNGAQYSDCSAVVERHQRVAQQFAVVFLVKNESAAQVRYTFDMDPRVVYGADFHEVRSVTRREDQVLRRAALRGARVIHGGVLATK